MRERNPRTRIFRREEEVVAKELWNSLGWATKEEESNREREKRSVVTTRSVEMDKASWKVC